MTKRETTYFESASSKWLHRQLENALSIFSYLQHGKQAIPTQNIDVPGGPDGLAAGGADQLAGAAGPLSASRGLRATLGRSHGPCPYHGRQTAPSDFDFIPVL